ncbi:MAG: hypothetical protein ACXVHJ_36125, partial [Solirubrobacteraceae bacterium]
MSVVKINPITVPRERFVELEQRFASRAGKVEEALKEGRREIDGGDGPMNPRLHLKLHEIVATQLWDDSPPEVWGTAVRLLDAGYERHEILHMLGRVVSDHVW